MPLPLKPGYNFNFDRTKRPPYYEMSSAEAYTDFYGLSYMISGERLIYSPTFTTITQARDMTFIPKNIYRRTTYISNAPYERVLLKFTDSFIADLIGTIGADTFNELCEEHVIHFHSDAHKKIMSVLDEMEKEWNSYGNYSELLLKGLLNKLIIMCIRERTIGDIKISNLERQHDYLANAIKYIKAHLRDNPSLKQVADNINISESYLSKIFVNYLHTPFSRFLLNEKIAYAQKLLLYSKMNMTEIAEEAGFSSCSYFSDCFKREMGEAPLSFRKKIQR